MTDIVDGLNALIKNTEGRLYDHERKFLETAVMHIQGMRAVAGKAEAGPSFREVSDTIPRRGFEPAIQSRLHNEDVAGTIIDDGEVTDFTTTYTKETTDEAH